MIEIIAKKITQRWIIKNVISTDFAESYTYGIQAIILSLLSIIELLVLGIVIDELQSSIIFLIVFITLRRYTGGYHATTVVKCHSYTLILYLVNIHLSKVVTLDITILFTAVLLLGVITIIIDGPVQNSNKQNNDSKLKKNKIKALYLYILICLIVLILPEQFIIIRYQILFILLDILYLMIVPKIVNKQKCKKGEKSK